MSEKLSADLNIIQSAPIELELLDGDLNIIQKLDDEPNDVGGLTSAELKAKFDESGNIIKKYINETLIPAVLAEDATEESRKQAEAARVAAEQVRQSNEAARQNAEAQRVSAENARNVWEDYSSSKAYAVGNKVASAGSSYLCIKPCTGIAPPNAEYWRLIAAKGAKGDTGAQGAQGPQGPQGAIGPEGPMGGSSNFVRYDAAQSLTDEQKAQARGNISALNGQFLWAEHGGGQIGWYRITEPFYQYSTSGYLTVSHAWANGGSSEFLLGVSTAPDTHGKLQCLRSAGQNNSVPYISNARLVKIANTYALDLYASGAGINDWDLQLCNCGHNLITLTTPTFISADDTLPDGETLAAVMEYQNPPMLLGVEYKTTERYLGKPVYVKAVDCGNLPAPGSTKNVSHGISGCLPIMVTAQMSNSNTIPWLGKFTVGADNTNIVLYSPADTSDFSGLTAMAILKYTKTTD